MAVLKKLIGKGKNADQRKSGKKKIKKLFKKVLTS